MPLLPSSGQLYSMCSLKSSNLRVVFRLAFGFVDEFGVFDDPVIGGSGIGWLPAREVLAVEDRLGRAPGLGRLAVERGSTHAGKLRNHRVAALLLAAQFAVFHLEIPGGGGAFGGVAGGPRKGQMGAGGVSVFCVGSAAGARVDAGGGGAGLPG